ncbi:MAG: DUF2169 domain-containing protein [Chitinivibrionales bacterium]|nr:DUF2169 domain-containing protein [Chitinivibrionales bacterium]
MSGNPQMEEIAILPSVDSNYNPVVSVILKRSYTIEPHKKAQRRDFVNPLIAMDEYGDNENPVMSLPIAESEFIPYKCSTDIVVRAVGYAPGLRPAYSFEVCADIQNRKKIIRVIGNRVCYYHDRKKLAFTEPQRVTSVPLTYTNAFGGVDTKAFTWRSIINDDERNPHFH